MPLISVVGGGVLLLGRCAVLGRAVLVGDVLLLPDAAPSETARSMGRDREGKD